MSASNAAAVRRRVGNQTQSQNQINNNGSITSSINNNEPITTSLRTNGMTLQEVITHFNTKINNLEVQLSTLSTNDSQNIPDDMSNVLNEFNERFELFAQEIALMKEQLLKLHSYTMDVNKVLYEERIHVLTNTNNNAIHIHDTGTINGSIDAEPLTDTQGVQSVIDVSNTLTNSEALTDTKGVQSVIDVSNTSNV